MSVTRVTSQMQHFDYLQCKCCHAVLPIAAIFCGQCGMRVDKDEMSDRNTPLSDQGEIAARYRITSLIRRRPAIQLSFALDTQLQRLIMLRDIDVSGLDETAKKLAYIELQQEYDLLRRQEIKDVMPLIALHYYEDHLYSVAGWPFAQSEGEAVLSSVSSSPRPYTLHDLLQSGIGLPNEQIAISWIAELTQAVERLHEYQIIIGELDPDTIVMSSYDYSSYPALMVSWLPAAIRQALSQISHPVHPPGFRAPEALYGQEDKLADIYSLGALLYLLLTGTAPDSVRGSSPKRYRMRSPRVLNPRVSRKLDAIVMQALALEPDKRFQHASELGEALLDLAKKMQTVRRPQITFARPPKSTPKLVEETSISSDMDNNGIKRSKEAALSVQEPDDETIQIEDIQEQLARSYWSRINTGPLSSQEKPTGEATVDKVQIQDKQIDKVVDNTYMSSILSETPKNKGGKAKKNKKPSNKKNRVLSEHIPEVVSSPEIQDKIGQAVMLSALVVETPVEVAKMVPSLEATTVIQTEEVLVASSSGTMVEEQTVAEPVESEQATEEALHQEASIDADQSQALVELEEKETVRLKVEEVDVEAKKEVGIGKEEEIEEEETVRLKVEEAKIEEEEIREQVEVEVEVKEEVRVGQEEKIEEEEIREQVEVEAEEEVGVGQEEEKIEEEETVRLKLEKVDVEAKEEVRVGQEEEDIEEEEAVQLELEEAKIEQEENRGQEDVEAKEEVRVGQEEEDIEEEEAVQLELEKAKIEQEEENRGQVEAEAKEEVNVRQEEEIEEEETIRLKLEKVKVEEEETRGQVEVEAKEEVSMGQEEETVRLKVEEKTKEQEHIGEGKGKAAEQEQASEEIPLQQEAVETEEEEADKQGEIEEKNIQKEEKSRIEVSQEENVLPTSKELVPQSTSHSEMLPALLPERNKRRVLARIKDLFISSRALLTRQEGKTNQDGSFLQRVQRFILGEQKHATMAAALIETPMRIQPTQSYAIRIQIIGRDQLKDKTQTSGLAALICGDIVHLEVRLALYQNYAYMVQQADVALPASGYAAEVTVPMHPLSSGPASRRERLHIFFMDKERNPLYEKPFVIELFVSPLVQLGHEGHNVLSIPI